MQLNLTGHHVDITRRCVLRQREAREAGAALRPRDQRERGADRGEAQASGRGFRECVQGQLFADATREDMYAAIDALIDKLDRQIIKHKEKLTNHHRGDGGIKAQGS